MRAERVLRSGTPWLGIALVALASLSGARARAADESELRIKLSRAASLVSSLILEGRDGFYGSAIAYDLDETSVYFLTNDHVVPRSAERRRALRLKGPITKFKPVAVTVLGRSPGYDVAVLAVPRGETQVEPGKTELQQRALAASFYRTVPEAPAGGHAAVIGVPRFWQAFDFLVVKTGGWAQEARRTCERERGPVPPSPEVLSEPVPIRTTADCPPPFLDRCYEIAFRTWGYSGGALVIEPRDPSLFYVLPIAGMVSHYSPLAETTYFIPIAKAIEVAGRLRARPRGNEPYVELRDPAGRFELEGENRVRLLTGPLAGKTVVDLYGPRPGGSESRSGGGPARPGGSESRSGGGDTRPGGSESRSGGGDSRPGGSESRSGGGGARPGPSFYVIPEESGITAFLGTYADLSRSIATPAAWGTLGDPFTEFVASTAPGKGVDALFEFVPGVRLSDGLVIRTYHVMDDKPIPSPRAFLREYATATTARLAEAFRARRVPRYLERPEGWLSAGLHTTGSVRRWKSWEIVNELAKKKVASTTGYTREELDAFVQNYAPGDGRTERVDDMVTQREQSSTLSIITSAELAHIVSRGSWILRFQDSSEGMIDLLHRGDWTQRGEAFFEQRGAFVVHREKPDRTGLAFGLAAVQWEPAKSRWELKLVLAVVPLGSEIPRDPYFTDGDEIRIEGFYVPLVDPLVQP